MPSSACIAIARKELAGALRNRWIWIVSALLATSVLVIAFFGTATVGVHGIHGSGALIASLMNLAVYLVPLLALVMGCGAIIDEKQRGMLDLILVYPVSTGEYFSGTFVGFALALMVAIVCGFGVSGLVLGLWSEVDRGGYVLLTIMALALGLIFLALSFLLSLVSRDRTRAVVASLFVWMCSVFVFDLVLVGLLVTFGGELPSGVFRTILLLNPTDVFRVLCFKWIGSAGSPLGLSALTPFVPSTALLVGVLVAWVVAPLCLSYALFQRRVANDTLI